MPDEKILIPIKIGMLGMSLEDIDQGEQGYVMLPVGVRNATMVGGREWVRVKVTAMENTRANRDIIIANEQGEIKEHTPVEISYEKSEGGYQRVGENYPLPTTHKHEKWGCYEYTAAVTDDDFAARLSAPHDLTPDSGKTLIVQDILLFANAASDVTIEGGAGSPSYVIYKAYLPAGGGSNIFNLGVKLQNAEDKIYVTVSAADVSVTITCDQR